MIKLIRLIRLIRLIPFLVVANCLADGVVVDRVYHPYVLANEREVEWRFMASKTDDKNRLAHAFAYGFSILENVVIETYIIGERDQRDDFDIRAIEIETRWMITEQGQYWADWGALFEFETDIDNSNYEATSAILIEKEFQKTSLTVNWFLVYEWGDNIESKLETEFRLKYRYRYIPEIQPAIELYSGEDFLGIGPALMGVYRFDGQKQIKWEAGFITEITHSGKDQTFRFSIEYEF